MSPSSHISSRFKSVIVISESRILNIVSRLEYCKLCCWPWSRQGLSPCITCAQHGAMLLEEPVHEAEEAQENVEMAEVEGPKGRMLGAK